jgi:hypothetical protein
LIHLMIFGEEYELWISPLRIFLHSPVTSSLLGPNILLSTLNTKIWYFRLHRNKIGVVTVNTFVLPQFTNWSGSFTFNLFRYVHSAYRNVNPRYVFTTHNVHLSHFLSEPTEGYGISFQRVRNFFYGSNIPKMDFCFLLCQHSDKDKPADSATIFSKTQL